MQEIASIIGSVSGVISLLGIAYLIGFWKGRVDTRLNSYDESCRQYPPAELWMMTKTMWDIYVVNVLHERPDLAEKRSPWRLKQAGKDLIPDRIKQQLDEIPLTPHCVDDVANGWLVVKAIGLNHLTDLAKEKDISVQEAIAVLSTYLDERQAQNGPTQG